MYSPCDSEAAGGSDEDTAGGAAVVGCCGDPKKIGINKLQVHGCPQSFGTGSLPIAHLEQKRKYSAKFRRIFALTVAVLL